MRVIYVVSHPCDHGYSDRCVVLCTDSQKAAEAKATQYEGGRIDVEEWS